METGRQPREGTASLNVRVAWLHVLGDTLGSVGAKRPSD
jgi:Co/Zn/Cd efflux system component